MGVSSQLLLLCTALLGATMFTLLIIHNETIVENVRKRLIAATANVQTDEDLDVSGSHQIVYPTYNDDSASIVHDIYYSPAEDDQEDQQPVGNDDEIDDESETTSSEETDNAPEREEQVNPMKGDEKLKKFPQCASSRRLEHPGIGDGPRVQYIHNPKAGGTSLQIATWKWTLNVPGSSFFKYDSNTMLGSSTKCPAGAFDATFLAGHRGYGYCRNIEHNPRGLFTFTAFRDPVSRLLSWYDYNLYKLHNSVAVNVFGRTDMELNELVKKYHETPELEYGEQLLRYAGQQQARFMCGYECMGPMAVANKNYTETYILERALKNLEKLDVIGITEELDQMVVQLKFHLPRLVPDDFAGFKRDNSFNKKSVLDDESRNILQKWAWVDETLYLRAKEIYADKQALAETCLALFGESLPKTASEAD